MSLKRLYQVPAEQIEDTTRWVSVLFCIPDTPGWKRLIVGMIDTLAYGRAYDEKTGSVIDAQEIGRRIAETMQICDIQTELDRIATAVETIAASHEPISLEDILTDMETQSTIWSNLADIAEVLTFLKSILPSFTLALPIGEWIKAFGLWRYRTSHINMLEDIAMSQRMQATAQMGTSGHSIYDLFDNPLEKLLLPAGYAGKAVWLWNRLKPEQIPAWVSWVSDLAGLLLGNIRDGVYSIANSVDNLETSFAPKLVAKCGGCGQTICQCYQTQQQTETTGIEFGTPPQYYGEVSVEVGSTDYYNRKCSMANTIYNNVLGYAQGLNNNSIAVFAGQEIGEHGLITLLGIILGELSTPVPILDAVAGGVIGYLAGIATEVIFGTFDTQNIVDGLIANQDELICKLYNAEDTQQAYSEWDTTLTTWGLSPGEVALIRAIMTPDVLMYLFFSGSAIIEASYSMANITYDCDQCETVNYYWTFDTDVEGWTYSPGNTTPPSTSVGDWVDNELRSVITEVSNSPQEGTWSIDVQSQAIIAAQGQVFRASIKRVQACATGVQVRVRYTDDTIEQTLYDVNFWTNYQWATHTIGAANVGKQIKSLELYTAIGPACNNGTQDVRVDKAEFYQ